MRTQPDATNEWTEQNNTATQPFVLSSRSDWLQRRTPRCFPVFHFTFWGAAPAPRTKAPSPSRHGPAPAPPALSWSRPSGGTCTLQSDTAVCVSKLLLFSVLNRPPRSFLNVRGQVCVSPYRCMTRCRCIGNQKVARQVMKTESMCVCYLFVFEWLTSEWITEYRE